MTPFAAVCFSVLMDHHGTGIEEAHPDYVAEKLQIMQSSTDAECFRRLDADNQHRVLNWARNWKQPCPGLDEDDGDTGKARRISSHENPRR